MNCEIKPIGIIESPFDSVINMPIQPLSAKGVRGKIILKKEYEPGLKDLSGFTYITLIYFLHKIKDYSLLVIPFMDTEEHGIFATRSPKRPNRIGLSTVRLIHIEKNIINIEDVDILNDTPLLDIKPFFPEFDNREKAKAGWLDKKNILNKNTLRSDNRFEEMSE